MWWRRNRELSEELEFHRRMAGREGGAGLGNEVLAAEMTRSQWRGRRLEQWLEGAASDLRFAARLARRRPLRSALAVLVLTLGIGGTTTIYTIVNAVLVRPLPYPRAAQLVAISSRYLGRGGGRVAPTVTLNEVERWRAAARSFDSLGSFVFSANAINIGRQALEPVTAGVDPEFLRTLRVSPAMGRNFNGSGSSRTSASVIISHRLWVEGFGSDPNVIGQTLKFEGSPMTVVGVLPAGFQFPRSDASYFAEDPDVLYPVANIAKAWGRDSAQWFAIGRLRPGVSAAAAQSELEAITRSMATANPAVRDTLPVLTPLRAATTAASRPLLLVIFSLSVLLLLIACANIMNLLLSSGEERWQEVAVRHALGASAGRILRQLLTECALLCAAAGVLGLGLTRLLLRAAVALWPAHLPASGAVSMDARVFAYTLLVVAAATLLAGIWPALRCRRRADLRPSGGVAGPGRLGLQQGLVAGQVALGIVLLACAGVLTHSLIRIGEVAPGFRVQGTLGFNLAFPGMKFRDLQPLESRILATVRATPGVASAGWITDLPPEPRVGMFVPVTAGSVRVIANNQIASEGYFPTAGIPILRGRDFSANDRPGSRPVAIVNASLARQLFPDADAIGRQLNAAVVGGPPETVVGVVPDMHDRGLTAPAVPTLYLPLSQVPWGYGSILVRTIDWRGPQRGYAARPARDAPAEALLAAIRKRIAAIDPGLPVTHGETTAARLEATLAAPRFYTFIALAFGGAALFLVAFGLYAVVAYATSVRTREFAVRAALGATRGRIVGEAWRGSVIVAGVGIAAGAALSPLATRALAAHLFEVGPIDAGSLLAASGLALMILLGASLVPAWRAGRVPPMQALRGE